MHGYPSSLFKGSGENQSPDVLLVLDQRGGGYDLTYQFQPDSSNPLHIKQISTADLDHNGKPEVIVEWAAMGAHWSSSDITVFESEGNGFKIFGLPKPTMNIGQSWYLIDTIKDKFDPSINIQTYEAEDFYSNKNDGVAVVYRNHDSCYACGEDDAWTILFLQEFGDIVTYDPTKPAVIYHGWREVKAILQQSGYQIQ